MNWTEDDMDFLTAMRVKAEAPKPIEQYDGGTEYDRSEDYWCTFFYGVLIVCLISLVIGLINVWIPMPEGF